MTKREKPIDAEKLGNDVIKLLDLKLDHSFTPARVNTSGGTKTALGLGLTILRVLDEN